MKGFIKKHPLLFLLFLGLLLRATLLFLDYSWDVNNHIAWAKDLWQRGFSSFYDRQSSEVYASLYPNYPPLSLYIFYLVYPLQTLIEKSAWFINISISFFPSKLIFFIQSRTFLAAMMKLPAVFADLGVAWLCYRIAQRILPKNQKAKYLIAGLILFNPAFFYNSAYWGQIDIFPIFFVLLSIYLLVFTKHQILSAIIFTIALLLKPTALVYLPIYAVFFIRKYSPVQLLMASLVSFFVFWVSFIPYLRNFQTLSVPFIIYSEKILAAQSLPFVTNGAFNFWVLITGFAGIKDTSPLIFGISYRIFGYIITGVFFAIIILNILKKKIVTETFFMSSFLGAYACFLFLTKMHERYSMLTLPFLLLASIRNRKLFKWFIVLSFISFLNLYHSWPVPRIEILAKIVSNSFFVYLISASNILIFFYFLRKYIKNERH